MDPKTVDAKIVEDPTVRVIHSTIFDRKSPRTPEWSISPGAAGELSVSYDSFVEGGPQMKGAPLSPTIARQLALELYRAADSVDGGLPRAAPGTSADSKRSDSDEDASPIWTAFKNTVFAGEKR